MALRLLEIVKKGTIINNTINIQRILTSRFQKGGITYGHVDGFLYKISDKKGDVKYWKCLDRENRGCSARLVTVPGPRNNFAIRKGGDTDSHTHPPNPEKVAAVRIVAAIKKEAIDHPERPPSAVARAVQNADEGVQAFLPDLQSVKKSVKRERLKNMPGTPMQIDDLESVPDIYRKTIGGDNFLLYDSFDDDDYTLNHRIMIFSTQANLKKLFKAEIWFADGTFDVVPSIFFQLFTIMGSVYQIYKGEERKFAIPLVHALLENKTEEAYTKVFEVILSQAQKYGLRVQLPQAVMSDFELAIINAIKTHLNPNSVHLCFFHLCQNVFKKIISEGLKVKYMDENDSSIRDAARSMCALAFVPVQDVLSLFDALYEEMPDDFLPIADYFEVTYVRGKPARGRRRAVAVRYTPESWNKYNAVLQGTARTNNASEGWHNRFQILVGRSHPSFFSFLTELQKEQADVEYILRELSLGKRVKEMPKNSYRKKEEKIFNIVSSYNEYVEEEDQLSYLKKIGYFTGL